MSGLRWVLPLLVVLAAASPRVVGQEAILSLDVEPASVALSSGGQAAFAVRVENESVWQADDLEFVWTGPADVSLVADPPSVVALGAFDSTTVRVIVTAAPSAAPGELRGELLEAIYTYCIGDLCYEILEPVPIALRITAPTETPPAETPSRDEIPPPVTASDRSPWPLVSLCLIALLLGVAWLAWRTPRVRPAAYVALAVAAGAGLGIGVSLDQHEQAQAVGAVLCTSCVGIETVETTKAAWTEAQAAALDGLTTPVDLLVFYAEWCRSCPFAEALVELAAARTSVVRYQHVDAEVERELAERHGVTRAGRTVVPAIVCLQTGRTLFGAENLASRLLALLQEAQ